MDNETFRFWSRHAADWAADYRATLRNRPVRAQTKPGFVGAALPLSPPEVAEDFDKIFADFEQVIMPGMTHWQHPRFFAYFPANADLASVLAEQLVTAIGAQCMLWQTSPAATELETLMISWLRQAVGLPEDFSGVIQDSASSSTLAAVLVMRERALKWAGNEQGLSGQPRLRIYCSSHTHSSIDRAIWVSGIGAENLAHIPCIGPHQAMDTAKLAKAIHEDRAQGFIPAGIIACVGGTSIGAYDDVAAICALAEAEGLFVHVDAAWAGAAMICPEFRHYWAGVERAHSIVINAHKWLGAQFDCSVHFIRQPEDLVRTLAIQPEYLKTHGQSGLINYSEWTVQLGRRFRALKLWFLMRSHGLEALRNMIRRHVAWAETLACRLAGEVDFEITSHPVLSLFSFRHKPKDGADTDDHNALLLQRINDDGRIYLTQTRHDGRFVIRFQAGSFHMEEQDIETAFQVITEMARAL